MKIVHGFCPEREFPLEDVLGCVGPGWRKLVVDLIDDLEVLGWNGELFQIKEKFGGLRFYINGGTPEIFDRISKAEADSYTCCEVCGEPGRARHPGWIRVLCDLHAGPDAVDFEAFPGP